MGRLLLLLLAALAGGGSAQDMVVSSQTLMQNMSERLEDQKAGLAGHSAFSYVIPCVAEPGGKNIVEPCGKMSPDGADKTFDVNFGTKLFSFTLPGFYEEEQATERWYTILLALVTLLVVVIPLVLLRFYRKKDFVALFGSIPRADKDPTMTDAENAHHDQQARDASGDAFIAPVNYYRCVAMLAIADPPDVTYVLWIKLLVMAVVVLGVQVGTPIFLFMGWAQRIHIVGIVPIFDIHPTEVPLRILAVGLAVLAAYKVFSRKVEDAYDANIYIISRRYVDPSESSSSETQHFWPWAIPPPSPVSEERKLLDKSKSTDNDVPPRNKAIKHFWLTMSMGLKCFLCLGTFILALAEVSVLEKVDWSAIVATLTALYLVADLDVTAMSLDSELKDRYRNYVCRLKEERGYDQDWQDRYTSMKHFFQASMQIASVIIILLVPILQFQDGDTLIPSRLDS